MNDLFEISKANKICLKKLNDLFGYTSQTIFPEIYNTLKNIICEYIKFDKVCVSMSNVMKSIINNSNWSDIYIQICEDYITALNHYKNDIIYNLKQLSYGYDVMNLPDAYNIIKDDRAEFSADNLSSYNKKSISFNDDEDLLNNSVSVVKYMEYTINKYNNIVDDGYYSLKEYKHNS